jgi:hypothetical protein
MLPIKYYRSHFAGINVSKRIRSIDPLCILTRKQDTEGNYVSGFTFFLKLMVIEASFFQGTSLTIRILCLTNDTSVPDEPVMSG